jgi:oligosaccharide repeat unit polymerase
MSIFIILICGFVFVLLGRWIFGKWFNHVSLYACIWSGSLALFELQLINYYPIEIETWIILISGGIAFMIGATTVAVVQYAFRKEGKAINVQSSNPVLNNQDVYYLKIILWSINLISILSALYTWYLVQKIFGSIQNAFAFGSLLYSYRVSEGLPGSIPYVSSLVFTGALFGGVFTARTEKLKIVSIIPLIAVVVIDLANMGRTNIIMAAILFFTGYLLTRGQNIFNIRKTIWQKLGRPVVFIVLSAIVILGAELVRSTRGAVETFVGSSSTLLKMRESSFITPSLYLYLTVNIGVLNQYLKHGDEDTPFGGHTFSSFYKILEKFGLDVHVETYQVRYNTPVGANTGTYLRELHGDFGTIGMLIGSYLVGFLSSVFWYRFRARHRYLDLVITALLFVIIIMSIFFMATRAGALLVYLITGIPIALFLDRLSWIRI